MGYAFFFCQGVPAITGGGSGDHKRAGASPGDPRKGATKTMADLTTRELGSLTDQLTREQVLVKKYKMYGAQCCDPQLRMKCQQVAARHQNHYNTLLNQLS